MRHERSSPSFFSGQSLLEIVVLLGILAIVVGVLLPVLSSQLSQVQTARDSLRAMSMAEEGLEAARAIRDQSWLSLTAGTHGLAISNGAWTFQGTSDTANNLVRDVTVIDVSATERQIVSRIAWQSPTGQAKTLTLTTHLTNWRNIAPPLLAGDWQNPQTLGTIDLGPGNAATGIVVRSDLAYMTAEASSAAKHDFYVIDVSNGVSPQVRGSINTSSGLNGVALNGSYAYVANQSSSQQLQVINVTTSTAPTLVKSLKLNGNNEEALSVAALGNVIYVGTEQDSGPEFFVIDVTSSTNPVIKGSLEIGADINRIAIFQGRVFLVTSKDTAELIVINASSSTNPIQSGSFNLAGTQDAKGLYLNPQDQRAYVGRETGGGNPELVMLDATNPDVPVLLGSKTFANDVNAIFAADSLAFFGTEESNEEFKIYDVRDPASIAYYSGYNFPQVAVDMAFEDNVVYVAVRSNDALRIITSQ